MRRPWFLFLTLVVACKSAPEVAPASAPTLVSQELVVVEQGLTDFRLRLLAKVDAASTAAVEKARYELVVDSKVVRSGEAPLSATAAPGQSAEVSFEESSTYVASADELRAMSERGGSMLAAVRGTLFVRQDGKLHELPFARSREVRVPRLLSVKLHELDAARYSADEANAIFYLGVVNPNPFPVKLSALSYAVNIGGKALSEGKLGTGEKVSPSSTGVFEVQVAVNKATHGAEVAKLIKTLTLPYSVKGELSGDLFKEPYELKGEIKLNVSK